MTETRGKYYTLTKSETEYLPERVLAFLRQCDGKAHAVTAPTIAEMIHFADRDGRKVRVVIRDLIAAGHPIAASISEPPGFYYITTKAEAEEYIAVMRSRIARSAERLNDFSRAAEARFGIASQPVLF